MSARDRCTLLLLGAIWGSSFLFMRVAVPELGPLALIGLRVAFATIALTALLAFRGELGTLRGHGAKWIVLGALNTAVPFTLFAWATQPLGAGLPSVLNSTVPLFGALVALVWLRERLARLRVLGLLLGFVGVVVLVANKIALNGDRTATLGVLAGLAAALHYAIAAHYSRRHFAGVPPLSVATGNMLGASLVVLPLVPFAWPAQRPSAAAFGSAIVLGLLCTALAYILYFRLIPRIGTTRSITVTYLIPVFGLIWSRLFLSEPLTPRTLIGSTIVLAGTALVMRAPAERPTPTTSHCSAPHPSSPPRTVR